MKVIIRLIDKSCRCHRSLMTAFDWSSQKECGWIVCAGYQSLPSDLHLQWWTGRHKLTRLIDKSSAWSCLDLFSSVFRRWVLDVRADRQLCSSSLFTLYESAVCWMRLSLFVYIWFSLSSTAQEFTPGCLLSLGGGDHEAFRLELMSDLMFTVFSFYHKEQVHHELPVVISLWDNSV